MRELDLQEIEMVAGGGDRPGDDCPSGHPYDDGWGSTPPSGDAGDRTDPPYTPPYGGYYVDGIWYPGNP